MIDHDRDPDVSEESPLAEQLDQTPVGVELAELLASVDRSQLSCDELLRLAAARQRQIAHNEAEMAADLHAIAHTVPTEKPSLHRSTRDTGKYPWAEAETSMALRWPHSRAAN